MGISRAESLRWYGGFGMAAALPLAFAPGPAGSKHADTRVDYPVGGGTMIIADPPQSGWSHGGS